MLSSTLVSCGNAKSTGYDSSSISGSEADSNKPSNIAKLSPLEIIRKIDSAAPILQTTSTGCSLAVIPNVNDKSTVTRLFTNDGFSPVQINTIDGAEFETLVFSRGETIVTMYLNKTKKEMRIMWEDESYLKYLKPNSSTSKGSIEIAQISVEVQSYGTSGIGMCYIIKLSNGHAVIIDGGERTKNCANNIYNSIERLDIAREDDKFLIDAWIFTHGHYDHTGAFLKFTPEYADYVSVGAFVFAIPSSDSVSTIECDTNLIMDTVNNYYSDSTIINPHAGLKYYFDNLTISMLYTPDMYYANDKKITFYNDTSLIFKAEGGNSSMVFFGDAGEGAAETMLSSYTPSTFKADAMQITHHGLHLVPGKKSDSENIRKVYEHINAKYALLPTGTNPLHSKTNARYINFVEYCNNNYQSAFFMDKTDNHGITPTQEYWENFVASVENGTNTHATFYGYDGKNIIKNGRGLTTYIAASDRDHMATVLSFKNGKITVKENEILALWIFQ